MERKSKKNNYLVQGTILVIASFIARAIGMIYRIPLTNILGPQGNAYYSTANEIYGIILMVSSFSLPLAVSKLVSERIHLGQRKNAYKVFRCGLKFALVSGGVMSILTLLFAGVITKHALQYENAVYALRVLAPAIFIFAIVGVFRGFFQGHDTMVPTASSQVIEQLVNAFASVLFANMLVSYGTQLGKENGNDLLGPAIGAAGGTLGTVISITVSLVFMIFIYLSYRRRLQRQMARDMTSYRESDKTIYRLLIATILPVVLSTVVYNISTIIDQGIFNKMLSDQGFTEHQYGYIWGIFVQFRVLMNVPLSIASCLAPSVVPSLTAAMADGNIREAGIKVRTSIRYTMLITIPCAVGMAALAGPIMRLLFPKYGDSALAAGIMQAGALMIVLFAISTLTTGILQGLGEFKAPLINAAIALVLHIVVLVIFLKPLNLNIYSVVYANIFFALLITLLNAYAIRRKINYRQELKKTFIIPLLASGAMGLITYGSYRLFALLAGNAVSTILAILIGVVVYVVFIVKLRGISEQEIYALPKGNAAVMLLRKCRIL